MRKLSLVVRGGILLAPALLALTLGQRSAKTMPLTPAAKLARSGLFLPPNMLSSRQAIQRLGADRDRFWLTAQHELSRSVKDLKDQNRKERQGGFQFAKLMCGDKKKKEIALTFDDGPHPAYTPKILDILDKYHVDATFFLVGEQAEKYPYLVRAQYARGNNIGNHTYHHVSLVKIPNSDVAAEIKSCGDVIRHILGRAPHLFRPPGGEYDPAVARLSDTMGYTMVLWTDDPGDYASPGADVILKRTLKRARNGGIILLHDGIQQTIDILPALIERLQKQGYEFVTVDRMMADRGKTTKAPLLAKRLRDTTA